MPTIAPFEAEYASWPICPSKAATEAVFTISPRSPSPSGSVRAMAAAALVMTLNVPITFSRWTNSKAPRSWGVPSRLMTRPAQPLPAQFTQIRRLPRAAAWSTACWQSPGTVTSPPT